MERELCLFQKLYNDFQTTRLLKTQTDCFGNLSNIVAKLRHSLALRSQFSSRATRLSAYLKSRQESLVDLISHVKARDFNVIRGWLRLVITTKQVTHPFCKLACDAYHNKCFGCRYSRFLFTRMSSAARLTSPAIVDLSFYGFSAWLRLTVVPGRLRRESLPPLRLD